MGEASRPRAARRYRTWRAHAAATALSCAVLLAACGTDGREGSDPVLASLKADPMGTREPDGFTLTDSTSTAREDKGAVTGKPTQAAWTRDFESTADADDSVTVLADLADAAEKEGWAIDYAGPSDVSATKTIDGEPAVLYAAVEPARSGPIPGAEQYTLQISLRS
jgi:hypothetical protein